MAYRNIPKPAGSRAWTKTAQWTEWALLTGIAPPVSPVPDGACGFCHGASGYFDGGTYPTCYSCANYGNALSALVPVAYSIDSGLESMLHRFKDWGDAYKWMRTALGSLALDFLITHLACIEERFGPITTACTVPSGNTDRTFDHLGAILGAVKPWPVTWDRSLLSKVKPGRPERGVVDATYYKVVPDVDLRGQTVLVFDDTWTSGASVVSAAASLRRAGAEHVVAFTIGRQLHAGYGSADELIAEVRARGGSHRTCVLCE